MILFLRHLIVTKHLEDAVSIMIVVIGNPLFFLFLSLLIAVYFYSTSLNKVSVNLTYRSTYGRNCSYSALQFLLTAACSLVYKINETIFFFHTAVNETLIYLCPLPVTGTPPPVYVHQPPNYTLPDQVKSVVNYLEMSWCEVKM